MGKSLTYNTVHRVEALEDRLSTNGKLIGVLAIYIAAVAYGTIRMYQKFDEMQRWNSTQTSGFWEELDSQRRVLITFGGRLTALETMHNKPEDVTIND